MSRVFATFALIACGLLASASSPAKSTDLPENSATTPMAVDGYRHEVRLRKMHLVRPDLIPYPAYQDFYA